MGLELVIGILATLIASFIVGSIRFFINKKDTNKILSFLEESKNDTDLEFRSNHAISSETDLTEDRVRKLCSKSKRIKRNANEKESWKLVN